MEIEKYVPTPARYAQMGRAEITRLAAIPGADPLVRLALWKVAYLHCREHNVRLVVIGARKSQSDSSGYEQNGVTRRFLHPTPLPYAGDLPHRIMAADIPEAEAYWQETQHPMLAFMVDQQHPDISVLRSMHRHVGDEIFGVDLTTPQICRSGFLRVR